MSLMPAISPSLLPLVIATDRDSPAVMGGIPARNQLAALFVERDGVWVDTIGLLITNNQVRTELRALFFDGEAKYDDATIAANIAASSGLLNMYELIGENDTAYALFAIGTPQSQLNRAIQYFYRRALFINSIPLCIDGKILEVV